MTKFVRDQFQYHGGYLTYGPEEDFVARFKYCSRDKAGFVSFLIKHFTVEEYFNLYDNGCGAAPVTILKSKGYVSATVKRILKDAGYEPTQTAYDQYIQDGIDRRAAAKANEAVIRTIVLV
jgi:hypothetical protein